MMSFRTLFLIGLVLGGAELSYGHELPGFGPLPKLDKEWKVSAQATQKSKWTSFSWVTFENTQSGDLLSFSVRRYARVKEYPKVELSGPWGQASIDAFPAGRPNTGTMGDPDLTVTSLRCSVVNIGFMRDRKNHRQAALEFTNVYERKNAAPLMGHGYGLALGDMQILLQHTSARPITAEFANDTATDLFTLFEKTQQRPLPSLGEIRREPAALEVLNMEAAPLQVTDAPRGWARVPEQLSKPAATVFMPVNPANGVSDYKVTRGGWVLAACNYDYQGNDSGDWRGSQWTKEEFQANGWQELTDKELGGKLITKENREQIIFVKKLSTGETGRLRCNKYDPPFLILCGS